MSNDDNQEFSVAVLRRQKKELRKAIELHMRTLANWGRCGAADAEYGAARERLEAVLKETE